MRLPDVKLKGRVTEIANSAKSSGMGTTDEKTEFEVKVAVIDPVAELRPGMTASAEIVTEVCEDCLSVPIQSVAVRTLEQLGAEAGGDEEDEEAAFRPGLRGIRRDRVGRRRRARRRRARSRPVSRARPTSRSSTVSEMTTRS